MPKPTLERVQRNDKSWEIRLRSPKDFDEALGRNVLNAFCRCFVHVDRLNSAISCMYVSQQHHGQDSIAYKRDVHTLLWFAIGTLHELATAIRQLRSALAKRQLLDSESAPWVALRRLEKQWKDNKSFREMRNKGAFHVDKDVVDKGLDKLSDERHVELVQGEGSRDVEGWLPLGFLALHHGLGLDLDRYGDFVEVAMADLGIARTNIQEAFILAAEAVGISPPASNPARPAPMAG